MKFAFVVNNYPPRVGGVESHVYALANQLTARGHEVLVVSLADAPGESVEDGVEVLRLGERARIGDVLGFPALGTTRKITKLLRERGTEIVSIHTRFFPMSWLGLRAGKRAGAAVMHTEHGSGHVVNASALIETASRMVDKTLGRSTLRGADTVLAVSDDAVEFVRELAGRGASVFYNGIDPDPNTDPIVSNTRLVFVGRLVSGKGADTFVEIVRQLAGELPDIEAVMLGDGPERERVAELIAQAGLQDRIRTLGWVSADEVREALRGAVLVNPTALPEGWQLTVIEALGVGARVATTDVPSARVALAQGLPVHIASDATAAALLPQVRAALADSGQELPAQWYWTERAAEFEQFAEATLSAKRR